MRDLTIAGRTVSASGAPYVIAEAGVHHCNSLALAREYVLRARIAGADAVKFQTYRADRLATTWAPLYWTEPGGPTTQHEVFAARSLLTVDDYRELFSYAAEMGVTLMSTPFDPDSADMLASLGMPAFKIASADLTNLPLLEHVARYGRPVLLSTGASSMDEVTAAVAVVTGAGAPLCLLHCSLAYPTAVEDGNLARITTLAERFPDVLLGYSDHTEPGRSMMACPTAVCLGARVIEKHFTLNRLLDHDDHYHAVDPAGLAQVVRNCKDAALLLGDGRELTQAEMPARENARRSIVAAHAIPADHQLTLEDVDFKRPGTGMSPSQLGEVVGRRTRVALEPDDLVTLDKLR